MIGRTQKELESGRPSIDAAEAVSFCLTQLYRDREHTLDEEVCHNLTYEELIGALLLARDIANAPVSGGTPSAQVAGSTGHVCRVSHLSDPPRCLDCGAEWPVAEPPMLPEERDRSNAPLHLQGGATAEPCNGESGC